MRDTNCFVVIMAGGVGSRYWPKSRQTFPKQFIDVLGTGKSLLQSTYDRFLKVCPQENIYISSNYDYLDLIRSQIPEISVNNILLEPSRNNTGPCIAYACYKLFDLNNDAQIIIAPSDHLILKEESFYETIQKAIEFSSSKEVLLTLGIVPTRPDTGYGYIKLNDDIGSGIYKVDQFMEKPAIEIAKQYVESGKYVWNAGIFIWSAKSIKRAFELHAREVHEIFTQGEGAYNTDLESNFINSRYSQSPNISIDYAIMEKADNIFTIPADIGWSDLGTWASLYQVADRDLNGNVLTCSEFHLDAVDNCLISLPANKSIVAKGLKDFIIVDDGKVLLIYPKSDEQEIKQVAQNMASNYGDKYC